MPSRVYYMPDRAASIETSMVAKLLTVFDAAGFAAMIQPMDLVAIKIHCGEYNNTGYIRPVYVRAMVDKIKSLGGRPFVCDTTTLSYTPFASRTTALDELLTAERNGFNSATLGAPFIVADGFNGTDDVRIDMPEGFILKEAYVAKAIALADALIALTHFKGHPMGVVGGSIKNLGIGGQSKRGKYNVHMGGHPKYGLGNSPYYPHLCLGTDCPIWQLCVASCPYGLFHIKEKKDGEDAFEWEHEKCTNCLSHLTVNMGCGVMGLTEDNFDAACAGMADAAKAVIKAVGTDKCGFINLAMDISPACDCVPYSDRMIVPNMGVFASKDIVALDRATLDQAKQSMGMPGSRAQDQGVLAPGLHKFSTAASLAGSSEDIQINVGVLNGMGSKEYELIECPPGNPFEHFPSFDPRPVGMKLERIFKKEPAFPYPPEQMFKRVDEVDFSKVR